MNAIQTNLASVVLALFVASTVAGGPPTREEVERHMRVVAELKQAVADAANPDGKLAVLTKAMAGEKNVEVRYKVLELAAQLPLAQLDAFLTDVLASDPDSGLRAKAAELLGKQGSEKVLPALVRAAATDKPSDCVRACIVHESSARRDATFAIAELAARHPKLADEAAKELRALKPADEPKGEGLPDARIQALYQVTRDEALLKPFYERLRSKDARTREEGVVAFRFLKLKAAPPELVATLADESADVRLWAALVVGEVADPKTVPQLLAVAADAKKEAGLRCNAIHSLGRMKAPAATETLRKLLADENQAVQVQAAIALYRITGEKVKQFPEGYNAD